MNCNEAFSVFELPSLTRNSHQTTAAGVHLPHFAKAMWGSPKSTALGSDKGLDVLYSTPSRFDEKCGLGFRLSIDSNYRKGFT